MKKKKLNECNISRDELEDAVEAYIIHSEKFDIPFSHSDAIEFIAEELGIDEDTCDNDFGSIIAHVINYDEGGYIDACDKMFYKQGLQDSFMKFVKNKRKRINEGRMLDKDELMKDPNLCAYRKTNAYRNADEEGKYRMLWRYVVSEHNANIRSEDELADVCMEIAMYDEQQF